MGSRVSYFKSLVKEAKYLPTCFTESRLNELLVSHFPVLEQLLLRACRSLEEFERQLQWLEDHSSGFEQNFQNRLGQEGPQNRERNNERLPVRRGGENPQPNNFRNTGTVPRVSNNNPGPSRENVQNRPNTNRGPVVESAVINDTVYEASTLFNSDPEELLEEAPVSPTIIRKCPTIAVKIGNVWVDVLVDSGSPLSCISQEFLKNFCGNCKMQINRFRCCLSAVSR